MIEGELNSSDSDVGVVRSDLQTGNVYILLAFTNLLVVESADELNIIEGASTALQTTGRTSTTSGTASGAKSVGLSHGSRTEVTSRTGQTGRYQDVSAVLGLELRNGSGGSRTVVRSLHTSRAGARGGDHGVRAHVKELLQVHHISTGRTLRKGTGEGVRTGAGSRTGARYLGLELIYQRDELFKAHRRYVLRLSGRSHQGEGHSYCYESHSGLRTNIFGYSHNKT